LNDYVLYGVTVILLSVRATETIFQERKVKALKNAKNTSLAFDGVKSLAKDVSPDERRIGIPRVPSTK
jgi:hypothetical protein